MKMIRRADGLTPGSEYLSPFGEWVRVARIVDHGIHGMVVYRTDGRSNSYWAEDLVRTRNYL